MSAPRSLREKGARTIIFNPHEIVSSIGIGSDVSPLTIPPLIAFKHNKASVYPTDNTPIKHYQQNRSRLNTIELNKIMAQAQRDKPQRADQLPQESSFELFRMDLLQAFQQFDTDFVYGKECYQISPDNNYYVHNLFSSGHLNFRLYGQIAISACQELLSNFLEHYTEQIIKAAHTHPYNPEVINYTEINAASQNIYGSSRRTLLKEGNIPLFHKKRQLNTEQFPLDFAQYIFVLVLPDDFDAGELKMWEEVVFDRLGFEGFQVFTQSQLANCYVGKSHGVLNVNLDLKRGYVQLSEPFQPVVARQYAVIQNTLFTLFQGFQYFVENCPELQSLKRMFGGVYDLKGFSFGAQDAVYASLSPELQTSVYECLLFQINKNIYDLFQSKIISLAEDENKQSTVQLNFPLAPDTPTSVLALKMSFALGWVGLATARLLFNVQAVPLQFASQLHLSISKFINYKLDPAAEQRDVQKTTKIQLTSDELKRVQFQNRDLIDDVNMVFVNQKNQNYMNQLQMKSKADIDDILTQFLFATYKNVKNNEQYLKEIGKNTAVNEMRVVNQEKDEEKTETQPQIVTEGSVAENLIKNLAENIYLTGIIGTGIGYLQETLIIKMQQKINQFKTEIADLATITFNINTDTYLNEYCKNKQQLVWVLAQIASISDGGIECALSKEEWEGIGSRAWIEKGSFWYPE
ncbi:Conserved_hypothetical protein [Hexamita inflata]|uniref:Uncharacterized protein n=1 Tax=Hexamita inflata TaxID=28002 RepID=A0AA86UQV9_9EUKA|nr:Conserved hypothetical protein [Hexamita inflata]